MPGDWERKSYLLKLHVCHFSCPHTQNEHKYNEEKWKERKKYKKRVELKWPKCYFWGQLIHFHKHAIATKRKSRIENAQIPRRHKYDFWEPLSPLSVRCIHGRKCASIFYISFKSIRLPKLHYSLVCPQSIGLLSCTTMWCMSVNFTQHL